MRSSNGGGTLSELAVATNITSDKIEIHFQIVIVEGVVLLGVQHFQQGRRGIAAEIHRHLVDFVEQEQRIAHAGLGQVLDDLAGQRADIGAAVAADLRLVAHSPQRHPHELAVGGAGDGASQRGLAHARRPDQAQDRSLELARPLLHGQVFENPFLDLLQPIMIGFQNRLGRCQILMNLGALAPGNADQPVDVVAHHRGLGRHRRHHLQFVQFRLGLGLGFLGHSRLLDALAQFLDFVGRILQIAEFLLNRLDLLVQIILALALFHLLLDPAANAFLDLKDVDLAFHQGQQMFEALGQSSGFPEFSASHPV